MSRVRSVVIALTASVALGSGRAQDLSKYVLVSHVLVETKEAANVGVGIVKGGVAIGHLAQRWSVDVASGKKGGKLGVERCDVYTPEFAKFVCAQPLGEVGVVQTSFGWHVVVVHARSDSPGSIVDRWPDLPEFNFAPTLTLSCSAAGTGGQAITVMIDEPNAAARIESRSALLSVSEVRFSALTSNGLEILIDRTTGEAAVKNLRDNSSVGGFQCRTAAKRLF